MQVREQSEQSTTLARMQQRRVRVWPMQHTIGDDVVGLLSHVDAVPIGAVSRGTHNSGVLVACPDVVPATAAAACHQRITDTCIPKRKTVEQ